MSTGGGAGAFGRPPPSHHPPIRDASTLKYVLYGPGHEKYPSWPMPAATEVPVAIKVPPTGGSQRSKSWTDHTNYPKEQIIPYTRPYMKRSNSSQPQQLKTVLERCEKKNFDSIQYLHNMDHRKSSNANDFNNPSPPERDQQKRDVSKIIYKTYSKESITPLTQADLEEYTKKFDETTLIQHQKQSSYAQSEGYHSYVSSSDSSSTPFIDSLKRDIDASVISMSHVSSWDGESTVTTRSGSVSSSETLKWHGSLSDMSDVSNSSRTSPRQLIVHSARVQTPQKQNSESVLYMPRSSISTDRPLQRAPFSSTLSSQRSNHLNSQVFPSPVAPRKTVAECINIYEGKNIKAIQKKALLSYYERHQDQSKKDVRHIMNNPHPQNATSHMNIHRQNSMDSSLMKKPLQQLETNNSKCLISSAIDSPNSIFQGPVIMGPSISLDEWVPERPPKNRQLLMPLSPDASLKPQRLTRPNMPMLSPSMHAADSDILFKYDDPFIASPEQEKELRQLSQRMSFDNFSQSGEPQTNINSPDKLSARKPPEMPAPAQGFTKTLDSNRKCINPYIKSTSMKYDSVHKIDQLNAKFNLQSGCDYHQNNVHARPEVPNNKRLHSNKSFVEKSGQFRAEPLDRKRELAERELKKSLHPLEVKKYVQNKFNLDSFNKSYEMSGQYRAEPLNLHPERHIPYVPMDPNRKQPPNKFNSAPPPVGPKIFRSKSESNHMTNMRNISHQANNCNNNFAKPIAPNQNIQRVFQNTETSNMSATQKLFGSKDSLSPKDMRTNKPYVEEAVLDFPILPCNNIPEKELENSCMRDDRPPLPEKKKNLISRNEETKPVKNVDIPLHIDTTENEQSDAQPEVSNPTLEKPMDSAEPMRNDSTIPPSEIQSESAEEAHIEPLQKQPTDIDQHEPSNAQCEKIKKPQTRPLLPEEIHWNKLLPVLLHSLPDSHSIRIIMSELEEYNNTAIDIINIFVNDVDAPTDEDMSANSTDPHSTMNNDAENIAETDENTDLIELSLKHSLNFISDKNKIEEYVDLLMAALQNQEESLEKMNKSNDETAGTIVSALNEPHSTRLNRLMTDIGLVTSLICGLMSRYNRLKKSIKDVSPNQKENNLEAEMARLTEKLEDAKALKIHIDSRKTKLLPILHSELKDATQSFDHFMSTKIRLIIHMRDIKDRLDIVKKLKTALNQEKPGFV